MAANLDRLEGKVDAVASKLERISESVAAMMPRSEVDAEIARRVSADLYAADQRAINERLMRLEASPQRLLGWVGAGIGCLGTFISLSMGGLFILEFILTHYKP